MFSVNKPAISNFVSNPSAYSSVNSSTDLSNISRKQALNNALTGNIDYLRAISQAERAEATSAREAAKAREWSAKEAEKVREWQEHLSNTAYSRAVKDLKSVGINPYAIGSFNASSTPSGAYGASFAGSGYSSSSPSSGSNIASMHNAYLNAATSITRGVINGLFDLL